jgi:two-component system response regulator AtoC
LPFKIFLLSKNESRSWWDEIKANRPDWSLAPIKNANEAVEQIRHLAPQVVLLDFEWQEISPLNFLRQTSEAASNAKFIGITRNNSHRLAVNAIKAGFHDVIDLRAEATKLQKELAKLAEHWQDEQKGEELHQQQKNKFDCSRIIGSSSAMQQVCEMLAKLAGRKWVNVLVRGETGTGKELVARTLHYNSFAQFQPFVEINCSAIPENLLESELFGYEKGAFTDAKTRKKGLFELAENGTLFLDEIGEISLPMQVKLLKAIEEKKIRRLGGTEEIQVTTRIIAATNRDLAAAIRDGRFRQDLFYRLNVIAIHLPALRERGDDVLLLAPFSRALCSSV